MKISLKSLFLLVLAVALSQQVQAQPAFYNTAQDTLQAFPVFSGLSPLMVQPRQVEILFFNALSTQKNQRLPETSPGELSRGTSLQHILQITYGVSEGGRFNLGFDLHYLHYRLDANVDNSPFKVLKSTASDTLVTDPNNDAILALSFHTLSKAGVRFRLVPVWNLPELTLQGGVLFPASYQAPSTRRALDIARSEFWVQGNFYQLIGEGLYGFAGLGAIVKLPSNAQKQTTLTPLANVIVAKEIPGDLLIVFAQTAFNASFNKQYKAGLSNTNYQLILGLGAQVKFSERFSLSAEFQKPVVNDYKSFTSTPVNGSQNNFSINLRYITGK
ncbi:MAG: hypothetical protein IPJ74_18330 [Saprospiraceae bacterium]|nr:hypothetical protein [Saprospiraceae bacterium]